MLTTAMKSVFCHSLDCCIAKMHFSSKLLIPTLFIIIPLLNNNHSMYLNRLIGVKGLN